LASASVASEPFAPGLISTMTGLPASFDSRSL
jgi:hypothetical protein